MTLTVRELMAGFFDVVRTDINRAALRTLSKFGAFVRQRARTSIRKRKKSAEPGHPPHSHAGDLRRLILFALDRDRKSVVVGPARFGKGEAPRLLERGGTTTRKTRTKGTRTLKYRGHPFMAPAGDAELPKFEALFRSMVK